MLTERDICVGFRNVWFFPNFFFYEVRNCPTITNVINVAAKREYLPFFVLLFISHTRNSYATSVPSTRLSYVALILEFRHGRSFVRRIQRGRGIILSICSSHINFQLYPKVARTTWFHSRWGVVSAQAVQKERATSFYKRKIIYIYTQNADASRISRNLTGVGRHTQYAWEMIASNWFFAAAASNFLLFIR